MEILNDKVYVFTCVWQFDNGDSGCEIETFSTIEEAKAYFKKEIENAKIDMERYETDHEESDTSFSIWEQEAYCYNHYDLMITECKVDRMVEPKTIFKEPE